MSPSESAPEKSAWSTYLIWIGAALLAYVLSSGPVTRFQPALADKLYAPLGLLAGHQSAGVPLRAWLRLWGVDAPR